MLAESSAVRDGRVVLAPALAFMPDLQIVVQAPVEGVPLELYLEGLHGAVTAGDRRGWDGVIRSAGALAAVHTAGLATDRERPIAAELKRFGKRAAQAAAVDPAIGGRMAELAAALPAWLDRLPEWDERITLVHGDCKHSQCMLSRRGRGDPRLGSLRHGRPSHRYRHLPGDAAADWHPPGAQGARLERLGGAHALAAGAGRSSFWMPTCAASGFGEQLPATRALVRGGGADAQGAAGLRPRPALAHAAGASRGGLAVLEEIRD